MLYIKLLSVLFPVGLFSEKHKQKDFVGVIQINCDVLCCVEGESEDAAYHFW